MLLCRDLLPRDDPLDLFVPGTGISQRGYRTDPCTLRAEYLALFVLPTDRWPSKRQYLRKTGHHYLFQFKTFSSS